jgi:transcriptional regulator with PAS, ATPase and Fis domain
MRCGTLCVVPTTTEPTQPEAGAPGRGEVLLVVGNGHLIVHVIAGDEVVIGRAEGCDLVLDHRALSRRHAVLRRRPSLSIQDLGSTNGVRIARSVVRGGEPIPLERGDSFRIGPFSFLVADAESTAPSTGRTGRERLIVEDPTPEGVPALVAEIARSGVNVLVQGATGVGKDVLAHTIHQLSGRPGPLLSINCAALSDALLESELFGHERGAFTGAVGPKQGLLEAAERGTLFLDEIGELPYAIQARLLRAVESREIRRLGSTKSIAIDVRIVAASNRDLAGEVAAGRFRDDLLFRLDGVTLRIPPLRDRRTAIAPLALKFIDEAARRLGRPDVRPTPELFAALTAHDWPGNVRELKAVIDRAVLLARGAQLGSRHLTFTLTAKDSGESPGAQVGAPPLLDAAEQADRDRMLAALDTCAGNQTRAAKALGIARSTLVAKMRLYRIPRPRT